MIAACSVWCRCENHFSVSAHSTSKGLRWEGCAGRTPCADHSAGNQRSLWTSPLVCLPVSLHKPSTGKTGLSISLDRILPCCSASLCVRERASVFVPHLSKKITPRQHIKGGRENVYRETLKSVLLGRHETLWGESRTRDVTLPSVSVSAGSC